MHRSPSRASPCVRVHRARRAHRAIHDIAAFVAMNAISSIETRFTSRHRQYSFRALLVGAMLLAVGVLPRAVLAQGCTSIEPPCPPPPPLSVSVQAVPDTVRANPTIVYFTVAGITPGTPSASSTVNGAPGPNPTFTIAPNGTDASGDLSLILGTGTHVVAITFCVDATCAQDATTILFKANPPPPARGTPIAVQEHGASFRRNLVGCADCTHAELSYSTPAYRSRDEDRSVTLVYSSALSAPMGTVVLDVNPNSSEAVEAISLSLVSNGAAVPLVTGGTEVFYSATAGTNRVTAQFDASAYPSLWYPMTAVVRNHFPDGDVREQQLAVRVMIANDKSSAWDASGFGNGWSVAGLQSLRIPNGVDAIVIENGSTTIFPGCGAYCWTAPPGETSTIVSGPNGTYLRRYVDSSFVQFEPASGRMVAASDRFGQTTTFSYYSDGRLSQVTDPSGYQTTITWSAARGAAGTASISTNGGTGQGGRTSVVHVDAAGDLTRVVEPDGVDALVATYANNRLVDATNRMLATTSYTYDAYGSLASVLAPAFVAEGVGSVRPTTTIRSRALALLPAPGTGSTLATRGVVVTPATAWTRIVGPGGDTTRILTTGAGQPTLAITRTPDGKADTTAIGYGSNDLPESLRTSSGTLMSYRWENGLLWTEEDLVAQRSTFYGRNAFGQVDTVTVNQKIVQVNTYSADSRSVLLTSTAGNATTSFTHDGLGRVLTMTDGAGHQTVYVYTQGTFENLQSVTKDGKTTQLAYDAYGRLSTVTDPTLQVTTHVYDLLNRPYSTTAPAQGTSQWAFTDPARTATFTDAIGQTSGTIVNALGAPVERWGPANPTVRDQYRYDSRGNLSSYTTRAARTGQVQHDALGRVTQISASDAPTITITYESAGKWVAYSNSESTDTVFVDGTGRVAKQVAVRSHAYALTSTFGVRGNREKLRVTSPTAWSGARELMFGVDTLGRPTMLSDFSGRATKITYNQDHQPQVITVPTDTSVSARLRLTHAYRPNERLDSVTSTVAPALLTWRYQYDSLARTRRQEWGVPPYTKRRVVEYDGAGRVYHWTDTQRSQGTPVWVCDDPMVPSTCHWEYPTVETVTAEEWRTFDLVGNRTDGSAVLNPGDRLLSFNGFTMAYDDDGNVVSKSGYGTTQSFTWNGLGQLTSVTTNGVVTSYGYDGLGRRVRKTVNGVPTRYLYDGDNLVMQLDASGVPVLEFSYYPGIDHPNAVKQMSTGKTFYYVLNASNNVIALVDTTNTVVNQYEYAMSGQAMVATEQVVQPFKFGAREFDAESGLYYNRARYYDPALTRFISEDPIGLDGGVNPYVYAGNDPVNNRDPSGTCPEGLTLLIEINSDTGDWSTRCVGPGASSRIAFLGAMAATARGGLSESQRSGFSANFGNQNARGRDAMHRWAAAQALESPQAYADPLTAASILLGAAAGRLSAVAAKPLLSNAAYALFRPGGILNRNRYLRIGIGRHEGLELVRISGRWVSRFRESGHIDLWTRGPWSR